MKGFFRFLGRLILALGVLLPLLSLVMELATQACAAQFFDPIPTWRHVVLVAMMPLGLALVWKARRTDDPRWRRIGSFAHGLSASSCLLYVLAMGMMNLFGLYILPFTVVLIAMPFALLLVLAMLGPLAAMVNWLSTLRRVWRWQERSRWIAGLCVGCAWLLFAELPMVMVHFRIENADYLLKGGEGADEQALEKLRTPSQESFLHHLCYSGGGGMGIGDFGPTAQLFNPQTGALGTLFRPAGFWTRSFEADTLRTIFFRVTGEQFSDRPPPRGFRNGGRGRSILDDWGRMDRENDFAWDGERGGDAVGARIRGLTLASSRMDWHVDAMSALAQGEWTLEFRNEHSNAQEARCQMLLPPGACVSRLTLWIDGEPREAAFGAKSAVKEAYRQTVVVDRRDPVMVNMTGPDQIMTQCFPVPPGGLMKIRLGLTAPVEDGLRMPLIVERNFGIGGSFKHALWVQSKDEMTGVEAVKAKDGLWSWQDEVPHAKWPQILVRSAKEPLKMVWAEDKLAGTEPKIVVRERIEAVSSKRQLLVVIDASAKLAPHAAKVRESLQKLPEGVLEGIWLSTDSGFEEVKAADLTEKHFRGGRYAIPSLKATLKQARGSKSPVSIVWLHGPQPVDVAGKESIEQLLERDAAPPEIQCISLVPGRNKLLEDLYDTTALKGGLRWDETADGLTALLLRVHENKSRTTRDTRSVAPPSQALHVWEHLARHATYLDVLAAFQGRDRVPEEQAKRAAQHQLVTPYSSAVVLETQQQYDRAGLKPVDASTTPQIPAGAPEPSRTLLALVSLACVVSRRRRIGFAA